jgi:Protein of unknown function (DUF3703)
MKPIVREHFETELRKAQLAIEAGEIESAWVALQRAHILGQAYPIPHAIAHWNMLKLVWRQRDFKEVAGQLLPTIVAIPLTMLFGQQRSLRGCYQVDRCPVCRSNSALPTKVTTAKQASSTAAV